MKSPQISLTYEVTKSKHTTTHNLQNQNFKSTLPARIINPSQPKKITLSWHVTIPSYSDPLPLSHMSRRTPWGWSGGQGVGQVPTPQ